MEIKEISFHTVSDPRGCLTSIEAECQEIPIDVKRVFYMHHVTEDRGGHAHIDTDQVIVAIGVSPNPLVPKSIQGLELGRKNTIVVNDEMRSSQPDIYAGGDIVRGGATVILAMGDGRRAAANMDKHLKEAK